MSAIETRELTKRFRRLGGYRDLLLYPWRESSNLAVDGISLAVESGELFGLLGENGAGKTTLIRMLTTSLLPTSGTASVVGHDVARDPHAVRRLIGLVTGEERSFYWRLTGRQNLEFFAALYHVPPRLARKRIDELLEVLGVADVGGSSFHAYSTGTRQRFDIARALLTQPHILFLDEPTRSLDPIAAHEVQDLVRDYIVGELGRTVVLATHSLPEAEALCGRVALLRRGRVVALGTVGELRRQLDLATSLQLRVRGPTSGLARSLASLPGVETLGSEPQGPSVVITLRLDRDGTPINDLLRTVLDADVLIESSTTREPTLDDIYRIVLGTPSIPETDTMRVAE